jgi:hypothetical protein
MKELTHQKKTRKRCMNRHSITKLESLFEVEKINMKKRIIICETIETKHQ